MPSAQGLDGDDAWNDERDVKANDGYVLMLGKGYGFRKRHGKYTG
jgi:hypothetical protein